MQIAKPDGATMTSREIAELTGKEHFHVRRDIESMFFELQEDASNFGCIYLDSMNRSQSEYRLNRELTEILLLGYSAPLRRKVIARLRELEELLIQPAKAPALPDFSNPVIAARAWADAKEAEQVALVQLEQAKPAVEFVGRFVEATGLKGFREVCKLLKANEARFREFLIDNKIMYKLGGSMTAYQNHMDAGRFEVRTGVADSEHAYTSTKFTPKGVSWIAGEWAKFNIAQG